VLAMFSFALQVSATISRHPRTTAVSHALRSSCQNSSSTPRASSEPPASPDSRAVTAGSLRHDLCPRVPAQFLRAYQPAHPVKLSKVARKRAQQCWSGLLKRIAKQVRSTLGDVLWADSARQLRRNVVLQGRLLKCLPQADSSLRGPPHGGACPCNFNVDMSCARAYVTLGELHLDHEQDLVVTCDMWHVGAGARGAPAPRAPAHVGRRRRRHAAVPPALLGARRPGGRGGDAALSLRPRARAARQQDRLLVPQAQHAALPRPARRVAINV